MVYKPKPGQDQQQSPQSQAAAEEVKQAQPVNPEQLPQISFAPMNPNLANNADFQELLAAMDPPLLAQKSSEQQPAAAQSNPGEQQPDPLSSSSTS